MTSESNPAADEFEWFVNDELVSMEDYLDVQPDWFGLDINVTVVVSNTMNENTTGVDYVTGFYFVNGKLKFLYKL